MYGTKNRAAVADEASSRSASEADLYQEGITMSIRSVAATPNSKKGAVPTFAWNSARSYWPRL
jgi:hypothetical protein